jgi:hypothetical protein
MIWPESLPAASLRGGLESLDEEADFPRVEYWGFTGLSFGNRGDFPESKPSPLSFFGVGKRGRFARGQFIELRTDVTKIPLEVFQH